MREAGQQNHRGRAQKPSSRPKSTHCATGSNQVWCWDITYLPGPVQGMYFYLYMINDIFSRDILGWEVWEDESSEHASQLILKAYMSQNIGMQDKPLVLHSDNGSPMKGATMMGILYKLGIKPSRSRPRVSNDNPYAESLFRTFKYRSEYPSKEFATIEEAREWVQGFVKWYRFSHHHSGIQFLSPNQVHTNQADAILTNRIKVYETAKQRNPRRWSGHIRNWELKKVVWLNPEETYTETESREMTVS